jgi:tRNA A37 threonylcarbamoyladenosine dehydratase
MNSNRSLPILHSVGFATVGFLKRFEMYSRSAAILGEEAMARLSSARVAVIGVGGVGGWCAEALARTGVGRLLLIDDDTVQPSNLNRQCPALTATMGSLKVEAMKARLLEINPELEVTALAARWTGSGPGDEKVFDADLIVDAIDSVDCKAELILQATEKGVPVVSSMGAALRSDPTKVAVKRFDKVAGDGLARALRARFKRLSRYPAAKFDCVCSEEPPIDCAQGAVKGSLMQVTAAFGMCLAAMAVKILTR